MELKNTLKRLIAAGLAACCVFSAGDIPLFSGFSPAARAEGERGLKYGDYSYEIVNDGAEITAYNGNDKNVAIPEKIGEDPVVSIGENAFSGMRIKSVKLPDTVKRIGYMAFCVCYFLEEITLPDSVESVSFKAFSGCASLKRINISSGTGGIEDGAFFMCPKIEKITVGKGSKSYKVKNGVLYSYDGTQLLICPTDKSGRSFKVPEGVEELGCCAFYCNDKLKTITLPSTLKSVNGYTFYKCSALTEAALPEGTTDIGACSFGECRSLKKLTIPRSVTQMDSSIFNGCPNVTVCGAEDSLAHRLAAGEDVPFRAIEPAAPGRVKRADAYISVSGKVSISWTRCDNADGYIIYASEEQNGSFKKVKTVSDITKTRAEITGFDPKKEHWFKVCAYRDENGNKVFGEDSGAVAAMPDPADGVDKWAEALLADEAPVYLSFYKTLCGDSFYISAAAKDDGDSSSLVITADGEKALIDIGDDDNRFSLLVLKDAVYQLSAKDKTAVLINGDYGYFRSGEALRSIVDAVFAIRAFPTEIRTGKMLFGGKNYFYETVSGRGDEVTVIYDKNKNIKGFIRRSDTSEYTLEIDKFNKKPGSAVFRIPDGYKVIKNSGAFPYG